jgi:hypothetical protein
MPKEARNVFYRGTLEQMLDREVTSKVVPATMWQSRQIEQLS